MTHVFILLTVFAYLLSSGLYLSFLYSGKEFTGRLATALMFLGLVCHYLALLGRAKAAHSVPYHDLQGSMSLFGWLLAVLYLCLEIYHRQRTVGAFVVPIILAFFFAANLVPDHPPTQSQPHGVVFALHVTLSILAYAGFALSCVLSLMFLAEERFLRMRKLSEVVWRLPSLELLERMSHTSVLVGLVTIAVGTALGFLAVDEHVGATHGYFDPKYIFTIVVLVLYAVYYRLARTATWRGARASLLCVFNFILVLLSFTLVNYISTNHRYF
ncbi:MAG TPA: cytochrome c biogenesis protein CcsA [Candidatus Eisenbacteria bacterium]|nr:cytochrome c biogenesis protein CcsA [Candidatus Eisenbacteria bacterium]